MDALSPAFNGITEIYPLRDCPLSVLTSPHLMYCENMSMRPSVIKIIMCNFKDVRILEDCVRVVNIVIRVRDGHPRHNG